LRIAKTKKQHQQKHKPAGQAEMKTTKRVYLDTNVYCRPLDDQRDIRIHAETTAFLQIVDNSEKGKTEIVSSDYVKFEIDQIQDPAKKKNIQSFEKTISKTNVKSNQQLINIAKEITAKCKLNSLDALHAAAACIGKTNYLLTCDDEILDHANCIETIAAKKSIS
jgi:predicted nucleic acid-binding protein